MQIEVFQTVVEKDGKISAYIDIKDDDGKTLKRPCIQGEDQAEIESGIQAHMEKLEQENNDQASAKATVQKAIESIQARRAVI